MLMRRKFQTPLFLISLIAGIVQMGYNWIVLKAASKLDMTSGIIFPAIVWHWPLYFMGTVVALPEKQAVALQLHYFIDSLELFCRNQPIAMVCNTS